MVPYGLKGYGFLIVNKRLTWWSSPHLPPPDGGKDKVAVEATSSVGFAYEMKAKMNAHSAVV